MMNKQYILAVIKTVGSIEAEYFVDALLHLVSTSGHWTWLEEELFARLCKEVKANAFKEAARKGFIGLLNEEEIIQSGCIALSNLIKYVAAPTDAGERRRQDLTANPEAVFGWLVPRIWDELISRARAATNAKVGSRRLSIARKARKLADKGAAKSEILVKLRITEQEYEDFITSSVYDLDGGEGRMSEEQELSFYEEAAEPAVIDAAGFSDFKVVVDAALEKYPCRKSSRQIWAILKDEPDMPQIEIARSLGITSEGVRKSMDVLFAFIRRHCPDITLE